jgi:histidine triad (HIT) family protein
MPCWKVYEDDHTLAFLDIFPQGPGHTLVIPKIQATNLLTFPPAQLGPYMTGVQIVAMAVQRAFTADGLSIMQFNGAAGGQTVFHLHFHIIPRGVGVDIKSHGKTGRADDAVLIEHQRAIRASLTVS